MCIFKHTNELFTLPEIMLLDAPELAATLYIFSLCPCHTTVYLPAYADVWEHVG